MGIFQTLCMSAEGEKPNVLRGPYTSTEQKCSNKLLKRNPKN